MAKRLIVKKMAAAAALAALAMAGTAQAASVTANASANVLAPLSISETAAMNFGDVAADSGAATTVVLTTAGSASSSDGAYVANNGAAAAFRVTGAASLSYTLTLPSSITLTSGANSVTVDTLSNNATQTLDATGVEVFNVGGTLHLSAGQAAGLYTGTYNVTVAY